MILFLIPFLFRNGSFDSTLESLRSNVSIRLYILFFLHNSFFLHFASSSGFFIYELLSMWVLCLFIDLLRKPVGILRGHVTPIIHLLIVEEDNRLFSVSNDIMVKVSQSYLLFLEIKSTLNQFWSNCFFTIFFVI